MTITIDDLKEFTTLTNVADEIDEKVLARIGARVVKLYGSDYDEVSDEMDEYEKIIELANQTVEPKNFPWEGAANTKFPLIPAAAIRFAASVYPEIIKTGDVVKPKVFGRDADESKIKRGKRVASFMNWQLMEQMPEWEEHTDKLLTMLPLVGCYFKKAFYSPLKRRNVSMLIPPTELIISKYTGDFDHVPRMTHSFSLTRNEIIERQRSGIFSDVDLPAKKTDDEDERDILEQHCWYDLDDDGYEEPYIITVDVQTRNVLRIVTRYNEQSILDDGKQVISIQPFNHFTKYVFFQSFDGSPYGMGWGRLLRATSETINTTVNQLLDAGTLDNLQGGLIGSGVRTEGGSFNLAPGEWQPVEVGAGGFSDNIFPIPTKGPSNEMLQLLQFLVSSAQDLASAKDVMSGDVPANAPATTVLAAIEQGYKVYSSIYKRIYKSLREEFKKLYELTSMYGDSELYLDVVDDEEADFDADFESSSRDIVPVANPEVSSSIQTLVKAQAMVQTLDSPSAQAAGVDARAVYENFFKALNVEDIDAVLPPPQPQEVQPSVDEKMLQLQAHALEVNADQERVKAAQKDEELDIKRRESEVKISETISRALKNIADAEASEVGTQMSLYKSELEAIQAELTGTDT